MKIDLAAEFNRAMAKVPSAVPAVLEVDMGAVAVALGTAWAEDMRENLMNGKRPDGKGPMPKRKLDGQPRGEGTRTVASIRLDWSQRTNRMAIVAEEVDRGTLKRILRGIPFRPPVTSERIKAVQESAGAIASPMIGAMQGRAATTRGRKFSAKRLADWRAWQAKKTAKAASSGLGGGIGSLGGMLGR